MNIITLHCDGEAVYFNTSHIILFKAAKGQQKGSWVVIPDGEWFVVEAPEQILRLIKGRQNAKV